jgi:putative SOS response-associated peptidase YedK
MEKRQQRFAERYKEILPPDWSKKTQFAELPVFYFVSGFTHPELVIVRHDGMFLFQWGLIPTWVKDMTLAIDIRSKTLNAVGETVFEKPSFRKSIASQRCLLAVSGFFEWRDINNVKYPYFIKTLSNDIFSLGCIWESWTDRSTGEIRNTFSIITTPANPLMERIHNLKKRMPLIIPPQDEKKWTDPSLTKEEIRSLIKPYNESDMTAYTVSKSVNNPRNERNIAESIEEVFYPELAGL